MFLTVHRWKSFPFKLISTSIFARTNDSSSLQCIHTSPKQSIEPTHLKLTRSNQKHPFLYLLLRHPNRQLSIRVHSQLITTGYGWNDDKTMLILNTLIRVYSQDLYPDEALKLYKQVLESFTSLVLIDSHTLSFLLKACANLEEPIKGIQFHASVIKLGLECHVYVQTSLVNMYSVCGCLVEALNVFDHMPERNLVTWNAMITGLVRGGELDVAISLFDEMPRRNVISWTGIIDGYTRSNRPKEALTLFCKMMAIDCLEPNEITIITVLPAVWNLGDLDMSHSIHGYCQKTGFTAFDIRVSNSLIDAYAKCGSITSAFKLFEEISSKRRSLVTWTSIISGFSMHGMAKDALQWFKEMEMEGLCPNQVTFLSVLTACSHGGLVKEGLGFFTKMVDVYCIMPEIKHYGCMIDMLGRAGMLEEAEKMALEMPKDMVNVVIWRTLLGACSFYGNATMGERVMRKILEMERDHGGDYAVMSNILVGVGKFAYAERVRGLIDERNISKNPALSLVDLRK